MGSDRAARVEAAQFRFESEDLDSGLEAQRGAISWSDHPVDARYNP